MPAVRSDDAGTSVVRWVVALVVLAAVGGFLGALLRPRPNADYGSPYEPPSVGLK